MDFFSQAEEKQKQGATNFGDWFADNNPEYQAGVKSGNRFGDWYEGPGGESATKLGLAAIAMFGPGAALMGGEGLFSGGDGGGSGGVFSQYGPQALKQFSNLAGGGGADDDFSMKKRKGILGGPAQPVGLFSNTDSLIAPEIAKVLYDAFRTGR